jgi:hypothetical protein
MDVMVWKLNLQLQPEPITTKVVSSKPVHGEVYSIQHYVIKFVTNLRQVTGAIPLACCNVFFVISFLKYQQKTKD